MANISDDVFKRMIKHIADGTTDMAGADLRVPSSNFSNETHARSERELFRKQPLVTALASELPEPGRFITRDLLGTALLIVRQDDGTVATFLNMCRHRGGKVERAESGKRKFFVCGYHGWSYERSGGLKGVPFEKCFDPLDRACHSLIPVKSEERHGMIWVDLSNDESRGVADFLGAEADAELVNFGIEKTVVFLQRQYPLNVNWKLVMDGAYDILHPQFLHPNGVGKLVHTNVGVWKDYGLHGQQFAARRRLAEAVKNGATPEAAWRYFATVFVIFPNTMIIAAPDHYEFWTVWPSNESASKSMTQIRFLIPPDKLNDEMGERLNRSLAILEEAAMNEDWPMEESIQANAATSPNANFIYGRSEVSCQHLHVQLQKAMASAEHSLTHDAG
jgi:phenylpropionate dioxygenase-like ring-hydroxylating dioxygenase large terminal subunit